MSSKIEDILGIAKSMLGDLSGYEKFESNAKDLRAELQGWRKDQFEEWCTDMSDLIDDGNNPLR